MCQPEKKIKRGRPQDDIIGSAFLQVAEFVENIEKSAEAVPIGKLVEMMGDILGDRDQAYSIRYMKIRLQQHFGESIVISEIAGKADVVYHRKTVSQILLDFHQNQQNASNEPLLVQKTSAKLIRNDSLSENFDTSFYPNSEDDAKCQVQFLPSSLRVASGQSQLS